MTDFICIDVFPMLGEQLRCSGETLALLTNVARVETPASRPLCGFSLLLALSLALRDFSLCTLIFPSPQKPND